MYISLWLVIGIYAIFITDDIYLIAKALNQYKSIRKRIDKRRGCKMPEKYC